ncbi:hypothetical protein ECANGB1_1611 [Enterospora canceri]|uniref:Uncharacterized protein n=1 Tax=Enterospora canceri TaxID=1081671 RepID=A0A1Y1S6W0_9MICR|nr:hypothetical protein ECANGB1_1611 [Enterospora canceri]
MHVDLIESSCTNSIMPTVYTSNNDLFIYSSQTKLHVFNKQTSTESQYNFDNISALLIQNDQLYVCTNCISIFNISSMQLINTINMSRTQITAVAVDETRICVSKTDMKIILYRSNNCDKIATYSTEFIPERIMLGRLYFGAYNGDNAVVYNYKGSRIFERKNSEEEIDLVEERGEDVVIQSGNKAYYVIEQKKEDCSEMVQNTTNNIRDDGKILSFNENMTGMVVWNNMVVTSTNDGELRFAEKLGSIFESIKVVEIGANKLISCMKCIDNKLMISVENKLYEMDQNYALNVIMEAEDEIVEFDCESEKVAVGLRNNTVVLNNSILVGLDNSITFIKFTCGHLAVGCADSHVYFYKKSSLSHTIPINKPISVYSTDKFIMIGGHRHVKILGHDLVELKAYGIKRPAVNCYIWNNEYFVAFTDIVKVFNKEKQVVWYNYNLPNAWYITDNADTNSIIVGNSQQIKVLQFVKRSIPSKAEMVKLKEMHLIKSNWVELMKVEEDERKEFQLLYKEYNKAILKNVNDIGEMLVKNGQIKDTEMFNRVLGEVKYDKKYRERVLRIIGKQKGAIGRIIREMEESNGFIGKND